MFKFNSLEIERYRTIDNLQIDATSLLITGPNGVGKTSILYALRDALYGLTHAACQTGHENETRLKADVYIKDRHIIIERTKHKSHLILDDNEEITSSREASKIISELLPKHVFTTLLLNLLSFPELAPSEKKDIFDVILHTHDLDKYTTATKILLDSTKDELLKITGRLEALKNQKEKLHQQLENTKLQYEEEIKKRQLRSIEISNELKRLEEEIASLEKQKEELAKLLSVSYERELELLRQNIRSLENNVEMLQKERLELYNKEVTISEKISLEQHKKELTQIQHQIDLLEQQMQKIVDEANSLKELHQQRLRNIENDQTMIVTKNKLDELQKQLEIASSTCPVCKRPAENIDKSISECPACQQPITKLEDELQKQIEQLQTQYEQIKKQIIANRNKESEQLQIKLQELRDEYGKLKETKKEFEKQLEEKKRIITELELVILEKENQYGQEILNKDKELESQIIELNKQIDQYKAQLNTLLEKQEKVQRIKLNIDEIVHKINSLIAKKNELIQELAICNEPIDTKQIDQLKQTLNELEIEIEELHKSKELHEKKSDNLTFWYKAFRKSIRTALLGEILPTINEKLVEYGDIFNKIPQIEIIRDEFHVTADGLHYRDLSTGERRICTFLTNFVLLQFIKTNFVAFDETFDGLDDGNIHKVAKILDKLQKDFDMNVIVITHNKMAVNILEGFEVLEF